ncbi:MAG: protease complex subunit PrcB family protein [Lachnospiraceae bacterium]|nr:protease complex subunit PrcB family protein [Lachnospiraceae bacterium]
MDKGIKATLCTTCAFAVMFAAVTGCAIKFTNNEAEQAASSAAAADSAADPATDKTAGDQSAAVTYKLPVQHYPNAAYISVKEDNDAPLPASGTAGSYEYTVLSSFGSSAPMQKNRGYYIDTPEEPDAPYYFIICSGQKSTGGHGISIVDLGMYGDKLYIVAEETSPAPDEMVTEAFEYPYCVLELDKLPKSYEVINTGGIYFPYIIEFSDDEDTQNILYDLNDEDDYQVPDGYCAVLNGGGGEIAYKTYVYYRNGKSGEQPYYEYIHVTSVTTSWGATTWRDRLDASGSKSTKEEIVETARQHGSGDFMTLPGDYRNAYSIDDFLKMDFIATDGSFT